MSASPDVVLITVDTLRADRVGGALTPAINAVGARGARFLAARTTVPLTLPAHVSLMTGAIPPATGVRLNGVHRFDGSRPTLATLFKDAGRETAAFVGAFVLDRQFGLATGSTPTTIRSPEPRAHRSTSKRSVRRRRWPIAPSPGCGNDSRRAGRRAGRTSCGPTSTIRTRPTRRLPTHGRARAGMPTTAKWRTPTRRSAGCSAAVAETSAGRPTLVVILGDHGESLGEHGERTHGMLLYDGALRIPLVIAGPGVSAGEHRRPVSIVDVAPTVLRLAGLGVSGGHAGPRSPLGLRRIPRGVCRDAVSRGRWDGRRWRRLSRSGGR